MKTKSTFHIYIKRNGKIRKTIEINKGGYKAAVEKRNALKEPDTEIWEIFSDSEKKIS